MTITEKLRLMDGINARTAAHAMTNRELWTAYTDGTGAAKYSALEEMAKRISRTLVTPDVAPIFKQYKLNGAQGDRW